MCHSVLCSQRRVRFRSWCSLPEHRCLAPFTSPLLHGNVSSTPPPQRSGLMVSLTFAQWSKFLKSEPSLPHSTVNGSLSLSTTARYPRSPTSAAIRTDRSAKAASLTADVGDRGYLAVVLKD